MSAPARIPVLVLTGFLGSGKTTLLNRLMAARPPGEGKLAVVVNEFGEVGIDGDLLPPDMTRQVELPGGCICCVLNEDLDTTLLDLIAGVPDLEMIVVETTGVAEPLPIAWALDREPLSDHARLAAVVTVVDALHFVASRPLSVAVDAQVEYADILVVSKLDLPDGHHAARETLAALDRLNPQAVRITTAPDATAAALWRAVADPDRPIAVPPRNAGHPRAHDPEAHHPENHPHESHRHEAVHHDHGHGEDRPHDAPTAPAHGFDTVWLPIKKLIDFEELTSQLEELPNNYVRIKGIARVIDESTGSRLPRFIVFHRVGTRVSWEPLNSPAEQRIVAIGPGIDRARLAACLDAAVVPSEPF